MTAFDAWSFVKPPTRSRAARKGAGARSSAAGSSATGELEFDTPTPAASTTPSITLTPASLVQLRDDIPTVDDPRWIEHDPTPLPEWVESIHPHQWDAVQELEEGYRRGMDVMFVDAPTGSGKTLIGELVRRRLGVDAAYVCSSKTLQDQFVTDYPYARVLKGRSNYRTQTYDPNITCADCDKTGAGDDAECSWCPAVWECEYEVAKQRALRSPLAVLNTSYLLAESNTAGRFSGRGLGIVDECDVTEKEVMGYVEFRLTDRQLAQLGVDAPKKGSHRTTIYAWFEDVLLPAIIDRLGAAPRTLPGMGIGSGVADVEAIRRRLKLQRLYQDARRVKERLAEELADRDEDGQGELVSWVRDNDAGPMVLKAVKVDDVAEMAMLRHADRWLFMSATIISPEQLADDLGFHRANDESGLKWDVVRVPMTFPVEHRPIYIAGVADMAARNKQEAWPVMQRAIGAVVERHPGEKVLVHTVSYELTRAISGYLQGRGRPVFTYDNAGSRDGAVARFRASTDGVMLAPSLDRGVDFKGDDCRVVVVAKMPYPYLGDMQVSARFNSRGGKQWYAVQSVRSLVQMTGRGVRSETDWCHTYILDKQFPTNLWKRNRRLFPEWWREAVDLSFNARELRAG